MMYPQPTYLAEAPHFAVGFEFDWFHFALECRPPWQTLRAWKGKVVFYSFSGCLEKWLMIFSALEMPGFKDEQQYV